MGTRERRKCLASPTLAVRTLALTFPSEGLNRLRRLGPYLAVGKGKGKAIRLQALRVPEVFRRLRIPDFKTIGT